MNEQYKKVIFLAHPDKGGSTKECADINFAKKVLLDPISRNNYKDALEKYHLDDGLQVDPKFDERQEEKRAKWEQA